VSVLQVATRGPVPFSRWQRELVFVPEQARNEPKPFVPDL